MTAHFVGQRVRVACPTSRRNGEEATITKLNVEGFDTFTMKVYIGHEVDFPPVNDIMPNQLLAFEPHELIPVTKKDLH